MLNHERRLKIFSPLSKCAVKVTPSPSLTRPSHLSNLDQTNTVRVFVLLVYVSHLRPVLVVHALLLPSPPLPRHASNCYLTKVLVESGGKGPVTLNVVVHEWLDNELTNHIVENAGAKNEVTVFVGNEFFVDLDVLKKGEHVLVPTGGTWKSVTPQVNGLICCLLSPSFHMTKTTIYLICSFVFLFFSSIFGF